MTWRKYISKEFIILVLVQYIGFKVSWLVTAWGAVEGPPYSYYGAFAFILFIVLHLLYSGKRWEIPFTLSVAVFGSLFDTVYNVTGFISYNGTYPVLDFLAPVWISTIWAGLAVTLDYSLKVLIGRPVWTFLTGAVFGPIAYWSGESMGAIHFNLPFWPTMLILAVPWGFALMGCYWLLGYFRPKVEV